MEIVLFVGGDVKGEHVELEYRYKGSLYIFREMPAGVCQQCGEKYLTAKVAKDIERRIQKKGTQNKTIEVPVIDFCKEVALRK